MIFCLSSSHICAAPFGIFDPRSLAMGGTGVAAGNAANAGHYNPALLATAYDVEHFSLVLPSVVVGLYDPSNLQDAMTTFNDANYATALDTAVTSFNSASTAAEISTTATAVATASQNLLTGINSLSNKSITLDARAGTLLAVPNKTVGFSVYSSVSVTGGTNLNITAADSQLVQNYIDVLSCLGAIDSALSTGTVAEQAQYLAAFQTCYNLSPGVIDSTTGDFTNLDTADSLTSTVKIRGAIIKETGFSFAHKFKSLYGIALGITPKVFRIETFDSEIGVNTATINIDNGRTTHNDSNFDLGLVIPSGYFKTGLVIKNVISKKYTTALNNTISFNPQYRAGVAFQNDWVLVSSDLDLVKNRGVGFDPDTQYFSLGVEFDLYNSLQGRLGYRKNLLVKYSITSLGIGLAPLGKHGPSFDFGFAFSGAGTEVGLQFKLML